MHVHKLNTKIQVIRSHGHGVRQELMMLGCMSMATRVTATLIAPFQVKLK